MSIGSALVCMRAHNRTGRRNSSVWYSHHCPMGGHPSDTLPLCFRVSGWTDQCCQPQVCHPVQHLPSEQACWKCPGWWPHHLQQDPGQTRILVEGGLGHYTYCQLCHPDNQWMWVNPQRPIDLISHLYTHWPWTALKQAILNESVEKRWWLTIHGHLSFVI